MEEIVKLMDYKVRIKGNKLNRDPFVEEFIIQARNKRDAGKQVDVILLDTSPKGRLYKYGHCEERFYSEIEPMG
jgi:hypothetical protein